MNLAWNDDWAPSNSMWPVMPLIRIVLFKSSPMSLLGGRHVWPDVIVTSFSNCVGRSLSSTRRSINNVPGVKVSDGYSQIKVYMTDVLLFAWWNLRGILIWTSGKKNRIVLFPRLAVHNREISLPVASKPAREKDLVLDEPWRQNKNMVTRNGIY